MNKDISFYDKLTFNGFQDLAKNKSLSKYEKVGFPESYRKGIEAHIYSDICKKVTNILNHQGNLMDIGPGCSDLPLMLVETCRKNNSKLSFVDGDQMLSMLPDDDFIQKYIGAFPNAIKDVQDDLEGTFNGIVCYSVIQYVFKEGNLWKFLDICMSLLSDGGQLLLGDIPNISMRKRFLGSSTGRKYHEEHFPNEDQPKIRYNLIEHGFIDDSVMFGILSRARNQGFHAWVLPQDHSLPFSNRREDILISKP